MYSGTACAAAGGGGGARVAAAVPGEGMYDPRPPWLGIGPILGNILPHEWSSPEAAVGRSWLEAAALASTPAGSWPLMRRRPSGVLAMSSSGLENGAPSPPPTWLGPLSNRSSLRAFWMGSID